MSEATRRTWIALGLAEAQFALLYPLGVFFAMKVPAVDARDGWADLALFATFLVAGVFFVLVGLPVAVHTVGRATEHYSRDQPRWRASGAHLAVGLVVGAIAGGLLLAVQHVALGALALAFVLPSGIAALGTHLLMPLAMRHHWIRIASWLVALLPAGAAFVGVALAAASNG